MAQAGTFFLLPSLSVYAQKILEMEAPLRWHKPGRAKKGVFLSLLSLRGVQRWEFFLSLSSLSVFPFLSLLSLSELPSLYMLRGYCDGGYFAMSSARAGKEGSFSSSLFVSLCCPEGFLL
jgi:hypothetical protein